MYEQNILDFKVYERVGESIVFDSRSLKKVLLDIRYLTSTFSYNAEAAENLCDWRVIVRDIECLK